MPKPLTKLLLIFVQGWIKLRNLQEPYIQSSSSCVVFDAAGDQKWTKVPGMTDNEKLLNIRR